MLLVDPNSYGLLLDLLADLLIEDFASDDKRHINLRPTTESVAINDQIEMA